MSKVVITYYKTNVGIFIRNLWGSFYNNWSSTSYFSNYKFNGKVYKDILVGGYLHLPNVSEIEMVEKLEQGRTFVVGYQLNDNTPEALKATLKNFYSAEEVNLEYEDDTEEPIFYLEDFNAVKSLYEAKYAQQEPSWVPIEFDLQLLGTLEIENYNTPEKMSIKVHQEGGFNNKVDTVDLSSIVCYSDFERMLTPEFMLHSRPCSLSSDQVYKIVRAYIKDNINPLTAQVTSDYDFCFTVKRKIHKTPIVVRTEIKKQNGRSYATPKFKTTTSSYDLVELFEMTPASEHYDGYTVIQGWSADNLQEMQQQVKVYLNSLMQEINKDVCKCEYCGGTGHIIKSIGTNAR